VGWWPGILGGRICLCTDINRSRHGVKAINHQLWAQVLGVMTREYGAMVHRWYDHRSLLGLWEVDWPTKFNELIEWVGEGAVDHGRYNALEARFLWPLASGLRPASSYLWPEARFLWPLRLRFFVDHVVYILQRILVPNGAPEWGIGPDWCARYWREKLQCHKGKKFADLWEVVLSGAPQTDLLSFRG